MGGILSSPRRRRRLAWSAAIVLLLGLLVGVGIRWSNTGLDLDTPLRDERARVYRAPEEVPRGAAALGPARATAARFVQTAVLRRDVADSWPLATRALRRGYSRAEWAAGDIPVVPYPPNVLQEVRWKLGYSYKNTVGLQVLLVPRPKAQLAPMVFDIELRATGSPGSRRWLVNSWSPRRGPPGGAAQPRTANPFLAVAAGEETRGRLSAYWLLVPAAVLGTGLLLPIMIGVRDWRRGVRADRRYNSTSSPS